MASLSKLDEWRKSSGLKDSSMLVVDDTWFMIDHKWWIVYKNHLLQDGPPPGPLDNIRFLLNPPPPTNSPQTNSPPSYPLTSLPLIPNLIPGSDFQMIPSSLHDLLTQKYGCLNTFPRIVSKDQSGNLCLESHGWECKFKVGEREEDRGVIIVSKHIPFLSLLHRILLSTSSPPTNLPPPTSPSFLNLLNSTYAVVEFDPIDPTASPLITDPHISDLTSRDYGIEGEMGMAIGYAMFELSDERSPAVPPTTVNEGGNMINGGYDDGMEVEGETGVEEKWMDKVRGTKQQNDSDEEEKKLLTPIFGSTSSSPAPSPFPSSPPSTPWSCNNHPNHPPSPATPRLTKKQRMFAVGLTNMGNTCYMSSSLQCLTSTEVLTNFILGPKFKDSINTESKNGSKGMLAESYRRLLTEMAMGGSTVMPKEFKKTIGKIQPQFNGYEQHDSHELAIAVLDHLHEDLNKITHKPYYEDKPEQKESQQDKDAAREAWDIYQTREDSFVTSTFTGQLRSCVRCPKSCGRVSITYDPLMCLSVDVPRSEVKIEYTIERLNGDVVKTYQYLQGGIKGKELAKKALNGREGWVGDLWRSKVHANKQEDILDGSKSDDIVIWELETEEEVLGKVGDNNLANDGNNGDNVVVEGEESWAPAIEKYLKAKPTHWRNLMERDPKICANQLEMHIGNIEKIKRSIDDYTERRNSSDEEGDEEPINLPDTPLTKVNFHLQIPPRFENLETIGDVLSLEEALESLNEENKKRMSRPKAGTPATFLVSIYHAYHNSQSSFGYYSNDEFGRPLILRVSKDATVRELKEVVRERLIRSNCWRGEVGNEENDNPRSSEGGGWAKEVQVKIENHQYNNDELADDDLIGRFYEDEDEKSHCWNSNSYSNYSSYNRKPKGPTAVNLKFCWSGQAKGAIDTDRWNNLPVEEGGSDSQRKGGTSLLDCIKNYSTEEQLSEEEAWYCSSCKEHVMAFKKLTIWKPPSILIIQLKRFIYERWHRDKIDTEVDFPLEGLDLSEYVGACEGDEKYVYDCYAVSNHYGGLGGGHYTAYAKKDTSWIHFDDGRVREVQPSDVGGKEAYVLYYKRREEPVEEVRVRMEDESIAGDQ